MGSLLRGHVFGLIATDCRRVWVSPQSDERHAAAKPSRLHQREENNSLVRETAVECGRCGGGGGGMGGTTQRARGGYLLSALCSGKLKGVWVTGKKGQPVFCCARLWLSDV